MPATASTVTNEDLVEIALYVYKYARRWVVAQSDHPEDAVIYDAAIAALNDHASHRRGLDIGHDTAVAARYLRRGHEELHGQFHLPVEPRDAVIVLHRYARRYTNGRGTYTAALVNEAARLLLAHDADLDSTRDLDGTIWAADGEHGKHDTLTPEQRREALDALDRD